MIYNRDNVPAAYSDKSRDYQVLLRLFDLVTNFIKLDIETFSYLISPELCPNHMLPLLASYLEYDYDYNETYESNRTVMRYFPKLLRHKGNEIGMKSAILLSCDISSEKMPNLNEIIADYDYANATIYIYYPSYLNKVRDLIEVVRPAGMRVVLLTYDRIKAVEVVGIYDDLLIINQEDYYGTLKESTSDGRNYYILDEGNKYIIGIGNDSRSVISDDYKENGSLIVPSDYFELDDGTKKIGFNKGELTDTIDSNKYLRSITTNSSEEYSENAPEFKEGVELNDNIKRISRIGFSEISGIRDKGDLKITLLKDSNDYVISDVNDNFIEVGDNDV